jgi:hypothetical protein
MRRPVPRDRLRLRARSEHATHCWRQGALTKVALIAAGEQLPCGWVLTRPAHDATRIRDHASVIEDEDRHLGGTTQAGDLGAISLPCQAMPRDAAVPLHRPDLVFVSGLIKRDGCPAAEVTGLPQRFLLAACIEDHSGELIRRECENASVCASRRVCLPFQTLRWCSGSSERVLGHGRTDLAFGPPSMLRRAAVRRSS